MNRKEALEHELCPQWLKDAEWDGDVDLLSGWPYVNWKYGTWKYGTWKRGLWKDGIWKDGTWEGGTWEGGTWEGGFLKGGIWKDGTWEGGTWEGGIWRDGTWEGGTWEGGIWRDGTWKDGFKSIGQCYWRIYYSKTHISIGCKTKTVEEWKEWFGGNEVYEHKRDSEQFKKIKQAYLMALAAIEIEKGEGEC